MATATAIVVLAIWAGIGAIFYEKPPCEDLHKIEQLDASGYTHTTYECRKQPWFH